MSEKLEFDNEDETNDPDLEDKEDEIFVNNIR